MTVRAKLLREAGSKSQSFVDLVSVQVRATIEGCHPLVAKTARFFGGIQPALDKQEKARERAKAAREPFFGWMRRPRAVCGRYAPDVDGCLWISATLTHIDWILRFHDALLRGLTENGCLARSSAKGRLVEIWKGGETVNLKFSEDYEKVPRRSGRKDDSLFLLANDRWDYKPLETFKLKMERQIGGVKEWRGRAEVLETKLPEIVRAFVIALDAQGPQRKFMEAEAAAQRVRDEKRAEESRAWFAAQKLIAERRAARKAQVDRAKAASVAHADYVSLSQFVEFSKRESPMRAKAMRSASGWHWCEKVSDDPVDKLIRDVRAEAVDGKALWWPDPAQPVTDDRSESERLVGHNDED